MNGNVIATLRHLCTVDEPQTTSDIAKAVFDPDSTEELRNADRKVRNYLTGTYSHLVESKKENGSKRYILKENAAWYGVGKIDVVTTGGEELALGLGEMLVYMDTDNRPVVVNVEEGPEEGGVHTPTS